MLKQNESKAIEQLCRLYRRLLVAYPRAHREEYGEAILQLFRDQCRESRAAGMRGLTSFWLRALFDLLKSCAVEHLSTIYQKKFMLNQFRPTFKPLPNFFRICALVFGAIFLGSLLITFLIPETYASSVRFLLRYAVVDTTAGAQSQPYVQIVIGTLRSPAVLDKAIEDLQLTQAWGKKYNAGKPLTVSMAETMIKSRLELRNYPNSDVIEIRAFSENPKEAVTLANGVFAAYREYMMEAGRQNSDASSPGPVTLINSALPNPRPVRPNKPLNIVAGVLVGILAGLIVTPIIMGIIAGMRNNRNPVPCPQNG